VITTNGKSYRMRKRSTDEKPADSTPALSKVAKKS
jgi:hypothetical protein